MGQHFEPEDMLILRALELCASGTMKNKSDIKSSRIFFYVDAFLFLGILPFCKTHFRILLLRNPIIIAGAVVLISGITGQMELSATKTFFVP
jgi:hypothetical protein